MHNPYVNLTKKVSHIVNIPEIQNFQDFLVISFYYFSVSRDVESVRLFYFTGKFMKLLELSIGRLKLQKKIR